MTVFRPSIILNILEMQQELKKELPPLRFWQGVIP